MEIRIAKALRIDEKQALRAHDYYQAHIRLRYYGMSKSISKSNPRLWSNARKKSAYCAGKCQEILEKIGV